MVLGQKTLYVDTLFFQDKSHLYEVGDQYKIKLKQIASDRNGNIQILSNTGILRPDKDLLTSDHHYRFMTDLSIKALENYKNQFLYLTDKSVFSNAWAGKVLINHDLSGASFVAAGEHFEFLLASESHLHFYQKNELAWSGALDKSQNLIELKYDPNQKVFWLLFESSIATFDPNTQLLTKVIDQDITLTCMLVHSNNHDLYAGSENGILHYNKSDLTLIEILTGLPATSITCLAEIEGKLWVGTKNGAYSVDDKAQINYYASRRWLVDDYVVDISAGPNESVLLLSQKGLSVISFEPMTLEDKAMHYERQVRARHIRHGFNSSQFVMQTPGDLSTGSVVDSDNDGLWTSMYLVSQLFRYKVTGSPEAYQNVIESFEAMERLNDINPIPGFLSRSFERRSYALHDRDAWRKADHPNWDWKGTTSSDESIGHYFAFCLIAEIIPDQSIKDRAIGLITDMTDHIIENDLYLVDIDGKPTRWGRWNPEYVNGFPVGVGDRKLNSSNITGFLQAAYHFTQDEKYKAEALRLFKDHGYLENLLLPMERIGVKKSDDLSAMLSESWNHSDDEMYFLSYWYLYPYAFDADLQKKYRETIKNHWNIERPEKDALWNFCYAMTGAELFDLDESIWYLKEFPLDLIDYSIQNSHRKDIELIPPNFRGQTTKTVLPPDEKPIYKHNTNTFVIDRNGGARSEASGDIYLLPYWMGRYLGVISAPEKH
ncbi:MAG: hypothetical protein HKN76_00335 [Saprospiraceae bacterium]|nr:hypothetical protein [Saprospiraceae bacterium]